MTDERLHKKQNTERETDGRTEISDVAHGAVSDAASAADDVKRKKDAKRDIKREKAEHDRKMRRMKRRIAASLEREAEAEREALLAGVNPYYINLSRRFRLAKIVCACLLAAFVVVMLGSFRDDITPENLRYMFRDMSITGTVYTNTSSVTISYEPDTEAVFCLFRGDIAMANTSGFALYSSTGGTVFSEKHGYKNPALVASETCIVAYDLGGNSYSVYNSLEKISEQTTAYPISGVAASDSGLYAVMTRNAEYRTVIYIYNAKGENIAQIFKDRLVLDMGFDAEGQRLFLTSVYNAEGEIRGELSVYSPYSDSALYTAALGAHIPAYAEFVSDGSVAIMTDGSFIIYKEDGTKKGEYEYEAYLLRTGVIGSQRSALAFPSLSVSGESDIYILSGTDKLLTVSASGEVKRLKESDGIIYALCSGSIIQMDPDSGEKAELAVDGNPCDINISEDTVFVSYYSRTVTYDLSEAFAPDNTDSEETSDALGK